MIRLSVLIFSLSFLAYTIAFSQPCRTIKWSQESLKWDHFTISENKNSHQKAFSSVGISYIAEVKNGNPHVRFTPFFIEEESWALYNDTNTLQLIHEQRLFDLTEVYARKMNEKIHLYSSVAQQIITASQMLAIVKNTYRDLTNEMLQEIQIYNVETCYGSNARMQEKWNHRIDTDLARLADFSSAE